jgi:hypothetical protein
MTMAVIFLSVPVSAMSCYQSFSNSVSGLGSAIEAVDNVPLIKKLINLLPFTIIAASLKQCPMQTMMVLAGVATYLLSQQELLNVSEVTSYLPWLKKTYTHVNDENLFVFDGDDETEDVMSLEDDLLGIDLLEGDCKNKHEHKRHSVYSDCTV